jgi:multidrug efflux system membrane fusion protein
VFNNRLSSGYFVLIVCTTLFAAGCGGDRKNAEKKGSAPPSPQVVVAKARVQPVPLEIRAIGNVEAYSRVQIKSQVAGEIRRLFFQEGEDVRQGQMLFEIDPREYQQAVAEAEAQIASAQAGLGQAEANHQRDLANAANARSQAERFDDLAAKGIISTQQNETQQTMAVAAEKGAASTQASIQSARAALKGAEARLADARLKLSYTQIRAPISGRTGNLAFKAGNLVAANAETPLVVLNQLSPAYVTFSIPEQSLADLRRYAASGKLKVSAYPQGGGKPAEGILNFLDNEVDQASGTILLKATFANQDRMLWPGQFVNVVVQLVTQNVVVIPAAALKTAQQGTYTFVVKADSTAEQRTVKSPRAWQDLAVVESGVKEGETVITEGQLRVKPGTKVQIVDTPQKAAAQQ